MKFEIGKRYRHKNCLDLDIEVLSIVYNLSYKTVLTVLYLNRNWQDGNFVIDSGPATIYCLQYKNWSKIS